MGRHICCVPTCFRKEEILHRFPNPEVDLDRFQLWVVLAGNTSIQSDEPATVYRSRRICHAHFEQRFIKSNNFLESNALPTLFLAVQLHVEEGQEIKDFNGAVDDSNSPTRKRSNLSEHYTPLLSEATTSGFGQTNVAEAIVDCGTPSQAQATSAFDEYGNAEATNISGTPPRSKVSLLQRINVTRSNQLTPKAKLMYKQAVQLKRQLRSSKFRNSSLKKRLQFAENCSKQELFAKATSTMTHIVSRFFKSQLENAERKARGRRFTLEDKVLALALFKQSGSAYTFLSKLFLLPSRKTLTNFLNRIPIQPGINECVFQVLESEAKLITKKTGKYCILMFDEMSICSNFSYDKKRDVLQGFEDFGYRRTEKIANHVQVFMLRNIEAKWKQPIYYNFVSGATNHSDIERILKLLIKKLSDIGLIVCATVCDQGTNNSSAIRNLIEKTRGDYLKENREMRGTFFEVAGNPVIPLFDPPHLLKGIRNNLLEKDLKCTIDGVELIAKWDHIYNAYLIDGVFGELRLMPKINDDHVHPSHVKKMKVSCCTKVFSHSVAVAINVAAKSGMTAETDKGIVKLPPEATQTAQVISFLDKLFDSVNGHAGFDVVGKVLRTCVTDKSPHVEFWRKAIIILKTMKFITRDGKTTTPPSVKNWITTLQGFIDLYTKMKGFGFTKMCPRTFNQDPLENFFGKIRQRGVRFTNPTVAAFTPFYTSLLVNNFTKGHSMGSNCERDEGDILISLQRFVTQDVQVHVRQLGVSSDIQVPKTFRKLKPLEATVLHYVSGFVSKKVLPKVRQCEICKRNILAENKEENGGEQEEDNLDKAIRVFTENREYDRKRRLKYCTTQFNDYLTIIYNIFNFVFPKVCHLGNVMQRIAQIITENVQFPFTSECEHSKVIEDLVINSLTKILLFHNIKTLNNIMLGKDKRSLDKAPSIFKAATLVYAKSRKTKKP